MKRLLVILLAVAGLLLGCSKAEDDGYWYLDPVPGGSIMENSNADEIAVKAIVTVKRDADGVVFLQLDEDQRLLPYDEIPFAGQQRAMCSLTILPAEDPVYGHRCKVHWLEALDEGTFLSADKSQAGNDGLEVLTDSWITGVEDGYLTIHYKAWWGIPAKHHDFTLLAGTDPLDPYKLVLMHDAHGDAQDEYSEGIVYFDINSLPPTGDGVVRLTLQWDDNKGLGKTAVFDYRSRK